MKKNLLFLFFLSSNFCLVVSQNVTITPVQIYPNHSYTPEEINDVVALSKSLEAQTKLVGISQNGNLTYDPIDKWPLGTWLRGYLSTQDSSVFFDDIMWYSGGECYDFSIGYWGSHPMIRHTGEQVRSMIHLYNRYYSGSNSGDYLNLIENGLNYLISAQTSTGSYINWNFRPSKYQPNIEGQIGPNQHHVYSTANALATMCEGYMFYNKHPNLNFSNMSGLYNAIENAANNLLSSTSECYSNSNFKGLMVWSLAKSYKITNNCEFLVKAVHISQTLINLQTKDASICNGIWQTGGPDGLVNHDTKIWYHLLIIKGLIETLDITPLTMHNFRVDLSNTIKRAVNHIILGRINLNINDPNRGTLRPIWVDPNCNTVSYDLAYNFASSVVEPVALLAYYSNYHQDLFTQQERTSLKNLLDLISTNANSFAIPSSNNQGAVSAFLNSKAMSYYADYSNAINTSQKVFNEDTPKIRNYDVNKITQRVVVGDFDRDGYKDDIAVFYDYGNSQTRIHMFKSTGSSFQYTGAAGYWQSTGYDVNLIKGRVVSGDFNNNGFEDDIAAFYDYGNNQSKIHVFLGNINNFIYTGANGYWNNSGYNANTITGRVLSGDFNNENKRNAIATFYDVGDEDARLHIWKYKPAYLIFPNRFEYQGPGGWWIDCLPYYDVQNLLRKHQPETDYFYSNVSQEKEFANTIKIFPNPSTNNVTISYQIDQVSEVSIILLTSTGSVLKTVFKGVQDEGNHIIPFNVSEFKPGVYYCIIKTENTSMSEKLVIIR